MCGIALRILCQQLVDQLFCCTGASAALLESELFCLCVQLFCGDVQTVLFRQSVDNLQIQVFLRPAVGDGDAEPL